MERIAKEQAEKELAVRIVLCGLFVHPKYPFIETIKNTKVDNPSPTPQPAIKTSKLLNL